MVRDRPVETSLSSSSSVFFFLLHDILPSIIHLTKIKSCQSQSSASVVEVDDPRGLVKQISPVNNSKRVTCKKQRDQISILYAFVPADKRTRSGIWLFASACDTTLLSAQKLWNSASLRDGVLMVRAQHSPFQLLCTKYTTHGGYTAWQLLTSAEIRYIRLSNAISQTNDNTDNSPVVCE